ncbi:MAG: hypothetical protein HC888_19770 [Candidatus Competibacteraceae bacterium]|nr:hypothetical protein [Candidatus Competibacteraceae bacterium]
MSWTTAEEIDRRIRKLWERGDLLRAMATGEALFPYAFRLKGPDSSALSASFGAVQDWIAGLMAARGRGYRIVFKTVQHRVIGENSIPAEIWVDRLDLALDLAGKQVEARTYAALLSETRNRFPALLPWMARYPLRALALADAWSRLLDVVAWLQAHPRPGIYLRQADVPGVHSKFIEGHQGVLSELLDVVLPDGALREEASRTTGFCRRYGFRDKPTRIRFRILDAACSPVAGIADLDITLTDEDFARLAVCVRRVFITENEINFLAFPPLPESMVVFGAGYGFEALGKAAWLQRVDVYYWGDIDTHGFAILDQLRARVPHAQAMLMDRATLQAHRSCWDTEPQQERRDLPRLQAAETALHDDLRENRLGVRVRLEQERIGYAWVARALDALAGAG